MYMRVYNHRGEIEAKTKSVSHLSLTGALKAISAPRAKTANMVAGFVDASGATPPEPGDDPGSDQPRRVVVAVVDEVVDEDPKVVSVGVSRVHEADTVPADVADAYYGKPLRTLEEDPQAAWTNEERELYEFWRKMAAPILL